MLSSTISLWDQLPEDDHLLLERLAGATGAFFLDQFDDTITTHIVSNWANEELMKVAGSRDNSHPPYVVTESWLIDSFLE